MAIYAQDRVGTLTAYYAKKSFEYFKVGDLIVDSNDPINRIIPYNQTYWKYEGDNTGEYYSSNIKKENVIVKKWEMNELPVSLVKNGATFVAKSGCKARIFWANNKGRKYCDSEGHEDDSTSRLFENGCFVLSAWIKNRERGMWLFEDPLYEERGNIKLYWSNRFGDYGCRKRPGRIGIIEEEWFNPKNWPEKKSAYSNDGRLLCNQWSSEGYITDYISIAYIASINALYIEGELYYKQ